MSLNIDVYQTHSTRMYQFYLLVTSISSPFEKRKNNKLGNINFSRR